MLSDGTQIVPRFIGIMCLLLSAPSLGCFSGGEAPTSSVEATHQTPTATAGKLVNEAFTEPRPDTATHYVGDKYWVEWLPSADFTEVLNESPFPWFVWAGATDTAPWMHRATPIQVPGWDVMNAAGYPVHYVSFFSGERPLYSGQSVNLGGSGNLLSQTFENSDGAKDYFLEVKWEPPLGAVEIKARLSFDGEELALLPTDSLPDVDGNGAPLPYELTHVWDPYQPHTYKCTKQVPTPAVGYPSICSGNKPVPWVLMWNFEQSNDNHGSQASYFWLRGADPVANTLTLESVSTLDWGPWAGFAGTLGVSVNYAKINSKEATICHQGDDGAVTLRVSLSALPAHIDRGHDGEELDYLGPCL